MKIENFKTQKINIDSFTDKQLEQVLGKSLARQIRRGDVIRREFSKQGVVTKVDTVAKSVTIEMRDEK